MEVTGILKLKFDTAKVSEKFQKRDLVVTTDFSTPYPQHVQMQLTQDKCSILDNFQVGDEIKIQFNLRGREWNGPQGVKYFNTLEAWRIEKVSGAATPAHDYHARPAVETPAPVFNSSITNNEDLPF